MTKEIEIIFENADVIVINKPSGLTVHEDGRSEVPTVTDWLLKKFPKIKNVGEPTTLASGQVIYRPGIVHRLDRDTSGVMIVAKKDVAFEHLKRQFHDHLVEKTYRAFVYGNVKEDDGSIDRPIGRSRSDFRLWSASRGARGEMRDAVTHFEVVRRGNALSKGELLPVTYMQLKPKTGRTHQIRVHLKTINHPVVADPLYAPKHPQVLGFKRLALHALSLSVNLPNGKTMCFEAPLPADFLKAEKLLKL